MSDKTTTQWAGATCNGACCPRPHGTAPRNPFGTCAHGHTCLYHITKERAAELRHQVELDLADMERRMRLTAKRRSWA
mgnify:CR=1 FL=1